MLLPWLMVMIISPLTWWPKLVCHYTSVYSQDEDIRMNVEVVLTFEEEILRLKKALSEKEKEKKSLQRKFKAEQDLVVKEQLQQELTSAGDVIIGLREEMISLSTGGAKLYDEPPVVKRKFDWRKDLELIFEPLLDQLREISERPRVLEKLEFDIIFWERRSRELKSAIESLQRNIHVVDSSLIKKDLQSLLGTALVRANTAEQKSSLLGNDLLSFEKKNPIWSTLGEVFSTIFLRIVFHFFIALFVAFLVYQVIRFLSLFPIFILVKNNPGETVFAERAIVVVRIVLGSALALMTYFIVLYSFSE
jgi:hypothetical protein